MKVECNFNIVRNNFTLNADFSIPAKGISAIFGPSGSGKTTILRLIAGLEKSKGYLKIGDDIWQDEKIFKPVYKRSVGYVFQEPSLFTHLNVQKNIEYGFKRAKNSNTSILANAIQLLKLENLLSCMPNTLSGGERQRVAIARAIAAKPKILLMDEPLASLDLEHKKEIMPFLSLLKTKLNIPIIYVSHSIDEIMQIADWLMLLENGQIIANDEIKNILTRQDAFAINKENHSAIIKAKVISYDEKYKLTKLKFCAGEFFIAEKNLKIGAKVRLKINAIDISLALNKNLSSILNILPAKVVKINYENQLYIIVTLQVGDDLLLAKITNKSAELLNIKVGLNLYAQIKTVAIISHIEKTF